MWDPLYSTIRTNFLECLRNVKFCGRDPNHPRGSFATGENMNALNSVIFYIYARQPLVRYGILLHSIRRKKKKKETQTGKYILKKKAEVFDELSIGYNLWNCINRGQLEFYRHGLKK